MIPISFPSPLGVCLVVGECACVLGMGATGGRRKQDASQPPMLYDVCMISALIGSRKNDNSC